MNFISIAAHTAAQFLGNPWIICAMITLIFGVGLTLIAKMVTQAKKPEVEDVTKTKMFKMMILFGLLLIVVGLLLVIIGTAIMTGLFA